MSKRVLITGATGFVGYHLIKKALDAKLEVYAAVRPASDISHLQEFKIEYLDLNYASAEELKNKLEFYKFNYIIHAAGVTKAKTKADYNLVNAEYTRNLAIAASTADVQLEKFVFVSSLAALGPLENISHQINDDAEGHPVTNYGVSKLLAEKYLHDIPNLPLIIVRPTAVYGPREKDIFIILQSINRGLEPYIGNFEQQLSFIYVKDLAEVIIKLLFSSLSGKQYNVSDGLIYDRYALAKFTKKILNKKTLKFHLPLSIVGLMAAFMDLLYINSKNTPALNKEKMAELTAINWACSIDRLKQDLDYKPKFNLETGLMESIKWYKENHWL